jgi:hypothetical protein
MLTFIYLEICVIQEYMEDADVLTVSINTCLCISVGSGTLQQREKTHQRNTANVIYDTEINNQE